MVNNIRFFYRFLRSFYFRKKYSFKNVQLGKSITLGQKVNLDSNVQIGDYSYVGQYSYLGPLTKVGNFAIFSDNINIIGSDHVFNKPGTPIILAGRPNKEAVTIIGDDVWLGHGVTIMRGLSIGNGVIVAANSVVTKNIPSYEIWGGIPAKKIKTRFNADEIKEHEKFLFDYRNGLVILNHDRKI